MTRMWMVNPKILCKDHLLGEHKEIHQLLGSLKKGHSIQGYLDKKIVEPQNIIQRHKEIVKEMENRDYNHNSELKEEDLKAIEDAPECNVDKTKSEMELFIRCDDCFNRNQELKNNKKGGKNVQNKKTKSN
ncbi:MAG: pyrimidine dimer DNA glycosylase/endonuclease V [Atribacterota bacterium]